MMKTTLPNYRTSTTLGFTGLCIGFDYSTTQLGSTQLNSITGNHLRVMRHMASIMASWQLSQAGSLSVLFAEKDIFWRETMNENKVLVTNRLGRVREDRH
jgi:hypothetical protein